MKFFSMHFSFEWWIYFSKKKKYRLFLLLETQNESMSLEIKKKTNFFFFKENMKKYHNFSLKRFVPFVKSLFKWFFWIHFLLHFEWKSFALLVFIQNRNIAHKKEYEQQVSAFSGYFPKDKNSREFCFFTIIEFDG